MASPLLLVDHGAAATAVQKMACRAAAAYAAFATTAITAAAAASVALLLMLLHREAQHTFLGTRRRGTCM